MAAERTPSRRKQCIFHKTFLKSPFGQLYRKRRRSSSSSSYDVHNPDTSQHTGEKWSPLESSIATLSHHQPHPGESADSGGGNRPPNVQPANVENVFLEPHPMVNQEAHLELAPRNCVDPQDVDFRDVCLDGLGQQEVDSDYSSISHTGDASPPHMVSPPSPSISSMETDVGVDPETGERALE